MSTVPAFIVVLFAALDDGSNARTCRVMTVHKFDNIPLCVMCV
jgi:hypothetical protein